MIADKQWQSRFVDSRSDIIVITIPQQPLNHAPKPTVTLFGGHRHLPHSLVSS
jgi:hypothetical protein